MDTMEHGSGNSRKFFPYARRNVAEKSAKPGECSARLGGSRHIASRRSGHHGVHAEGDDWENATVEEAEEAIEEAEEAGRRRPRHYVDLAADWRIGSDGAGVK
ncbi:hypothetical protein V501_00354 [Pseudogymnoascus sp. VKM F-4519 (FW-2642)]|nr:hypothetical protein V501_00354 [Pseudogymnoascus sp. VKM F-4519 (FW-2642)]